MNDRLVSLTDARIDLGDRNLFGTLDLMVGRNDRLCLVGRNGSGKSTLLQVLAGNRELDGGTRFVEPGVTIGYLAQEMARSPGPSIADFITADIGGDDEAGHRDAEAAMDAAGLDGGAELATLSGGAFRKVAILRALLGAPDLLLLDEPTNHMDLPAIEWLEDRIAAHRGGLVVISHDRAFLRRVANGCLWLDRGRLHRLNAGFERFDDWSAELLAREARDAEKLDKRIAEETRWLREGLTARRKRNQGRLHRLEQMRAERAKRQSATGKAALEAGQTPRSGRLVVEAENISKAFGGRTVVANFSTRILRGDRIGIIGPNGAGKTTLLSMLTGRLDPDDGHIRLGANLEVNVIDQNRAELAEHATLRQVLTGGNYDQVDVQGRPRHVIGYMKDFLFEPEQIEMSVSALSGGERNRLLLARAFARPSNLLILDEPTNDLDMETLDLLQEVLADYAGTIVLVSHDRDFLDRVVTSTVAFEGDGRWREYPGGYSDYLRQRPGENRSAKPGAKSQRKNRPRQDHTPSRRSLSSRQRQTLEKLAGEIAELEREIALLETAISDPGAYQRNPEKFRIATERLERLKSTLAEKEEAWLELELLKDELAGS